MYFGATIQTTENTNGMPCWTILSEKYVKEAVDNIKLKLSKSKHRLK